MASSSWWVLLPLAALAAVTALAAGYRRAMLEWRARSQHWFNVAMGSTPMLDSDAAGRMLRYIFRPMGAVPTTYRLQSERAWRERRALSSPDHTRLHFCDAATDSEAAREILTFCVGGLETMEGE